MRLTDIRRTTSFRLAMLFLLLFGTASVTLFGVMYWKTEGFLAGRVDAWLGREQANLQRMQPGELTEHVSGHAIYDPTMERPFALFAADGKRLAGNPITLPQTLPALDHPFDYVLLQGGEAVRYRANIHRLPSGDLLMIAETLENVHAFDAVLASAIGWGGMVTGLLGLLGAIATGIGSVRRIDAVTLAIQRIVRGDLSGRLPNGGSSDDLGRLVHVVNGMLDEIERLMHEVKGVCDNIAHDLRTPLTRLLAGLERARRRAASVDDYGAAVDEAIADTKGVLRTFAAMLRISEVEDGARRAGFTTVDLAQIAADAIELYEPAAEAKGIALALPGETARSDMRGDPSLLFEAVANLVDNAIKFTPPGGRVGVQIFNAKGRPGIAVSDTGPGIPAEAREAVLLRFHRLDKSGHSPGSGLGLSLVSAIARLHGMGLTITSDGPGCCVTLLVQEGAEGSVLTAGS